MPVLAAVLLAAQAGCGFFVLPDGTPPRLQGPPDITSRVQIANQPDSPIVIVAADFSQFVLNVGPSSFESGGKVSLDLKNVSNQTLTDVKVSVSTRGSTGAVGTINGLHFTKPLEPGATVRLQGGGDGHGYGTSPDDGRTFVLILVDAVQTADCLYKPSLAIALSR